MEQKVELINKQLEALMNQTKSSVLRDAMNYAVMNGGKRLRPVLMLTVLEAYNIDYTHYKDVACAIEMVHTYSLIHDDLPAMDNDDFRRGNPTVHRKYNDAIAILAGDALLTDAFSVITKNQYLTDGQKVKLISILSLGAGSKGMVYGQLKDLEFEGKTVSLEQLKDIHSHKTACLIQTPLMAAAIIAAPEDMSIWSKIGYNIGMAFQIQDDVLEVVSSDTMLGKSKSDERLNKSTYVKLLGLEESKHEVEQHFEKTFELLQGLKIEQLPVLNILKKMYHRQN